MASISETLPPELERFWRTDDGMTAVQRAEAYRIDISLLEANLALTPGERLRQNDAVLNEAEAFRSALLASNERIDSITRRLAEAKVEFVVAGGLSALMRGSSLVTREVAMACRMAPDNLLKVISVLADLHPVHRMTPDKLPFTREQAEKGDLKNLYLATDWGQLDCLGEIKGLGGYAECLAQSEVVSIDGTEVRVLTLLITAKRAMGRPRDLHAVLELEAIREKLRGSR